ncbi:MAG: hypothetical protein V3U13_08075 [Gemmatimonadota bacterium]
MPFAASRPTETQFLAGSEVAIISWVPSGVGCDIDFRASNSGRKSILIDMQNSRVKSSGGWWKEIKKVSNVNVKSGKTRNFTVKVDLKCAANRDWDFKLKRGSDRVTMRYHQGFGAGPNTRHDLGDLAKQF